MSKRIERDNIRFKQIIRGELKKSLKKFITQGKIERFIGKKKISIPIPNVDIPHFEYGDNMGIGAGEGPGGNQPGDKPGEDVFEVGLSLEEIAELLGEDLALPNLQPKGKKNIIEEKYVYTGIRRIGPESLRHFKRTYKEALKRQVMSNEYDPNNPVIIPIKKDKRYRSWKLKLIPISSAVVIYMMDTSGSMGKEQVDLVRRISFAMNSWLMSKYKGLVVRYIIHDAEAKEVSMEQFFTRSSDGGTKISTAYSLCQEIIKKNYPPIDTNIYAFHFSDGDNWNEDSKKALKILDELVSEVNLFGYGQVKSAWGSGQFLENIKTYKPWPDNLRWAKINEPNDVYLTIKKFLGKGK